MTQKYREEKKKIGSGASPSEWEYYLAVHEIVGSFRCNDSSLQEESFEFYDSVPTEAAEPFISALDEPNHCLLYDTGRDTEIVHVVVVPLFRTTFTLILMGI